MKEKFAKLIDVKSIVTILMTIALVILLFWNRNTPKEILMLFSTSYGAVITYFFTHKKDEGQK
jgi:amino acid transporter